MACAFSDERSSLVEDDAYSGLELWRFLRLRYFVDSLSSGSTLGKVALFDSGLKTEFAGFDTVIVLQSTNFIVRGRNRLMRNSPSEPFARPPQKPGERRGQKGSCTQNENGIVC